MIAILAPGQGAQKPGMLGPWLERPGLRERLAAFSDAAGLDLEHLGTEADAEAIADTAVTQPLLVASALLSGEALLGELGGIDSLPAGTTVGGHSVGELAAAAIAGVLTPEKAVALAAVRGREMAAACAVEPTSMAAILGGEADVVLAALAERDLEPANRNGTGQVVAAGRTSDIEALAAEPPEGVRVRPLAVAGAFHTRFMEPAEKALSAWVGEHRDELAPADPVLALLSDADGTVVTSGSDVLDRLVAQVTLSVRWDACMDTLRENGITGAVELTPAGTLTGMVKRQIKGTATANVSTPDDLAAAVELVRGEQA
ncbi:ACP S-malonyltransferase [Actinomycetospora endophytica]|uniref:[acyl-carrier-protein] S-malonyltransferase n=1 Tax=Actinomycetospora endophytica TaxID=2291215 RepID=A0ABS8PEH5_9PSEU|nr:ACP S-malonyltransferase [Actinomycetospora endophytica]MCD2195890.1 ACP S-malonyltransferase [Actinomycetospora endophytica]